MIVTEQLLGYRTFSKRRNFHLLKRQPIAGGAPTKDEKSSGLSFSEQRERDAHAL